MALRSTLMEETYKHRRDWLKQLLEDRFKGNQSEFARKVETSQGNIHDLVHGRFTIGERFARRVEAALDLNPGTLDKQVEWQEPRGDRRQSQKPKRQRVAA